MANFRHTLNGVTYRIGQTTNIDGTTHYRVFFSNGKLTSNKIAEQVRKSIIK